MTRGVFGGGTGLLDFCCPGQCTMKIHRLRGFTGSRLIDVGDELAPAIRSNSLPDQAPAALTNTSPSISDRPLVLDSTTTLDTLLKSSTFASIIVASTYLTPRSMAWEEYWRSIKDRLIARDDKAPFSSLHEQIPMGRSILHLKSCKSQLIAHQHWAREIYSLDYPVLTAKSN